MRGRERTVTVYVVLCDSENPDYEGAAGDGTYIQRFRELASAQAYARGRTCYGRPADVQTDREVPRSLAQRWGVA